MTQPSYEPIFTLQEIRRALVRHRGKAIAFFSVTMLLAVAAVLFCPPKYASDAKLFVRVGRESVTLDPTATTGQTIDVFESREVEINSILEVLRSRTLAEKVIDQIGAEVILKKTKRSAPPSKIIAGLKSLLGRDRVTLREKAIKELQETLDITSPKRTSVITIRCKSHSPRLAQQIVTTLVESFQLEHVRVNRTAGSYDFFVEQSRLMDTTLKKATNDLRDAKNEMKLASIDGRRDNLQRQVSTIEIAIVDARAEMAASAARVDALTESVARLPERLLTDETRGHPNLAADNMSQTLYQLQVKEQDLLSKLTEEHPQVRAIREQVAQLKEILARQAPQRTQSTTAKNPAREALHLQLLTEQAKAASVQANVDELLAQRLLVIQQIKTLNDNEVLIAQLQRNVELADVNFRTYSEKLEQARIHNALESDRISNVNIIQTASFVGKPVSPRLSLVLALSLMFGGCGALGVVLLAERLDSSLGTPEEVEQRLELPVLLTVPHVARRDMLINAN